MSVLPYEYDTNVNVAAQGQSQSQPTLAGDEWAMHVTPRLPSDLEAQAHTLGALQRKRGLGNATDLLRALLAYVLCAPSFRQLGAWAVLLELADISEAAWRKRLRCANLWLLWLLAELLASPPSTAPPTSALLGQGKLAKRILLVDATTLSHPGGSGDEWRVHTSYNLLAARLAHVTVGDRHSGEHLGHYQLHRDDIVLADNCYGYRRSVAMARSCNADVVLRINLSSFPLETERGQPFDVAAWLYCTVERYRRKGRVAYCWYKGQRYRVRVLALRLPPQQARCAVKRKERCAQKHGYKPSAQSLAVAGWVILVTTLSKEEWSDEAVLRLYRARWQIELVFKRMKQIISLDELRIKERVGVEAVIRLKLIAWALQEQEMNVVREVLREVQSTNPREGEGCLSVWLLTRLCVQMLQGQVAGHWTMGRLKECLPMLRRYLCGSARQRPHQETEVREWLSRPFIQPTRLTTVLSAVPSTPQMAA